VAVKDEEEKVEKVAKKGENLEKRAVDPEKVRNVVANLEKREKVADADVK
jgi:hypothetical protein